MNDKASESLNHERNNFDCMQCKKLYDSIFYLLSLAEPELSSVTCFVLIRSSISVANSASQIKVGKYICLQ
jgi:hypothetical protein